ncbi:hypothetical protein QAC21B_03438 [Acinetobacter bohemicus]|nr:hypothetical protein QAC21B_02999 [Acinetobacter bohemicus]CAD9197267.1 hypothetical protein QAC21B_03438 [Acinetobacter bohemicus]
MKNESILLICLIALIFLCAVMGNSENNNFALGWL